MEIRVIKNVNRFYHRSWFNWWEIIFYFRAVTIGTEDRYAVLEQFHAFQYQAGSAFTTIRLLYPFEAVLYSATSTIIGEHVTFSEKLDPADWLGGRFIPLTRWVASPVQFRIRWKHPLSREAWYTDFPYSYPQDWVGNYAIVSMRNRMDLFAGGMIGPNAISPATTVSFARHDRVKGWLNVQGWVADRHAYSDNRRRWGY